VGENLSTQDVTNVFNIRLNTNLLVSKSVTVKGKLVISFQDQ